MRKFNKKGFTLIELLAVIVILGILMLTAIPAVTRAIAKSRRNTFWQNAKQYIQSVQTPFLAGEYKDGSNVCSIPAPGYAVKMDLNNIELEGGTNKKSSFGVSYTTSGDCKPYVIVVNAGSATNGTDKLIWYFVGTDQNSNGIDTPVAEGDLSIAKVKTGNATECTAVAPGTTAAKTKTCTIGN